MADATKSDAKPKEIRGCLFYVFYLIVGGLILWIAAYMGWLSQLSEIVHETF